MSFRMSSIQFMTNYQSSLNKTYQKQAKLLEQGDGSSIHRGSDDPIAYSKLLRYKVSANENDQYTKNVQNATAWMQTTDAALTHMAEITKTFKEKTIAAATDVNNEENFDAIAKEMWTMIEEVYATSKTQHDGRYVFSGQKDKSEPFTLSTETVERAVTKTLNNSQVSFFIGSDTSVGNTVYQFVQLQGVSDNKIYYLDVYDGKIYDQDLVESGYKEYITQGKSSIADIGTDASVVNSSVAWKAEMTNISSDTAISEVSKLLTNEVNNKVVDTATGVTAATVASEVVSALTNKIYSFNVESSDTCIYALNEIAQASDSKNQITEVLKKAGISTDTAIVDTFKSVLESNKTLLKQSNMVTGYYLNNNGTLKNGDTVKMQVQKTDGTWENKEFKILTEPQQMIRYHGDGNYISMVKLNGATDTVADIVNAVGQDLFGNDVFDSKCSGYGTASGSSMINNMIAIYNKVKAGDVKWLSSDGMLLADAANTTVTAAQTTIGARLQLYTSVEEMLANQSDNITEEITNVSGTDVAKMATDLMEMTTLYNMALALGGRILPQSLADYL